MKKTQSPISLKSVTNSDVKFLFDLLKERDPRANISHKKCLHIANILNLLNQSHIQNGT